MEKTETMTTYICDGCGERFRDENGCVGYIDYDIWEQAESDGWLEIDGKHYCPNCYEHDDDLDDYRPKTKQTDDR